MKDLDPENAPPGYMAVDAAGCKLCDLGPQGGPKCRATNAYPCAPEDRADGHEVAFVRRPSAAMDGTPIPQSDGDTIASLRAELAEWRKLQNPVTLHANLLRGLPAKLTPEQVWHLVADDRDRLAELEAEAGKLRAENEALRADAEQWRALDSHHRFWVDKREQIIDAVAAAGFQIVTTMQGVRLMPHGAAIDAARAKEQS